MNTEEVNNKLIAEFLGWKEKEKDFMFNPKTNGSLYIKTLLFHRDWSWLMQVVEKIESLGFNTKIESLEHTRVSVGDGKLNTLFQVDKETKIEAVYNACVTFIEWYNSGQKK